MHIKQHHTVTTALNLAASISTLQPTYRSVHDGGITEQSNTPWFMAQAHCAMAVGLREADTSNISQMID